MFHAVWKWLILPIVFVVTQPYAAFRYLALVLLVGANVAIIVTSSLPGLPTLISSLPPAALSFTLEFTRAWVSHRRADGHLSRQQMVLMGVALIVLCAQAIFMVFLAIQSDDRFAQASNLACVVHTICVEVGASAAFAQLLTYSPCKYGTRIRFLNRSLPSRGILCIVLFIQVPFLAAGAYLLFTSNLGIVWALVPILFLAYFVSLISIIQSRSDLKALMGDNLSSRRKETGYVLKNAAYATGICFLMSAAVLGVGVAFGWNALFSCEFFLVQAPCVHCIMHSTRESKEEDSSEAGITSSLRFVYVSFSSCCRPKILPFPPPDHTAMTRMKTMLFPLTSWHSPSSVMTSPSSLSPPPSLLHLQAARTCRMTRQMVIRKWTSRIVLLN